MNRYTLDFDGVTIVVLAFPNQRAMLVCAESNSVPDATLRAAIAAAARVDFGGTVEITWTEDDWTTDADTNGISRVARVRRVG